MDISTGEAILIGLLAVPSLWFHGRLVGYLWRKWRGREPSRIAGFMRFDGRR